MQYVCAYGVYELFFNFRYFIHFHMVRVEHTSLLDRHQHSNIALDFRHSRLSGTIGYSIFMPGHHVLKLGCMPSGS